MLKHPIHHLRSTLLAVLLTGLSALAFAAGEPFSEQRFAALQQEGALVLVDVHASWCPTCAKQQEVITAYIAARPQVKLHHLIVDFDNDKQWVTHFRAPRQSTLLLFRGTEQVWFSVAETREEEIFAAIDKAAAAAP
jgi:thiol-disulfide isomerase/thioredoxin